MIKQAKEEEKPFVEEESEAFIRKGKIDDDLFIINYEDTWQQLFNTKQTMRIILAQSILFGVWYVNKSLLSTISITPKKQHGLGLKKDQFNDCMFTGLLPTLIFIIFFARL